MSVAVISSRQSGKRRRIPKMFRNRTKILCGQSKNFDNVGS
jgi:hypothetical protein